MKTKRIFMSLFGVIICAVSVGMFKLAALGVDPFQSLMSGLDKLTPLPFGPLYVIVNVILLLFSLFADRHYIGIATFINLFLLGYITQWTYEFLQEIITEPSLTTRVIFLLVAIVIICFGSSLYMAADLGVSTYDAVALILVHKWHIGHFRYIRIITDVICLIAGALLFLCGNGKINEIPTFIGIGTIITALFMGPLIELFNKKFAIPILREKPKDLYHLR